MGGRHRGAEQRFKQGARRRGHRMHEKHRVPADVRAMERTHSGLYVSHDYYGRHIVARCRGDRFLAGPAATGEHHGTDEKTRTELEAAVYRRLVEHLRERTDVQNIDLMNLAGFCRNCLSNWMKDAADAQGVPMIEGREPRDRLRHALRRMAREISEGSVAAAEGGVRKSKASQKH